MASAPGTATVSRHAGVAVGTGDHQPMQHGEIDGAFGVEPEMPLTQIPLHHCAAADLVPEPTERQVGSDAAAVQFRQLAAVEGKRPATAVWRLWSTGRTVDAYSAQRPISWGASTGVAG
jgi:hypothetical protein